MTPCRQETIQCYHSLGTFLKNHLNLILPQSLTAPLFFRYCSFLVLTGMNLAPSLPPSCISSINYQAQTIRKTSRLFFALWIDPKKNTRDMRIKCRGGACPMPFPPYPNSLRFITHTQCHTSSSSTRTEK